MREVNPRAVVLFGSVARGDSGLGSDADILIISDRIPENFDDRLRLLYEMNRSMAPIEPLGYTPKEFELMLKRRHPTALYALADGLPLHDDGFYKQKKREFERMVVDLRLSRGRHGWSAEKILNQLLRQSNKSK